MTERVVLVDPSDRPLGTAEKLQAHAEGWLHRAFSVLVFDADGHLLLQKRHADKYHSGGLWSNTCCSHPRPGEALGEAATRRLQEEMGFSCSVQRAFGFRYEASVADDLKEHEYDHVFIGHTDRRPTVRPHPDEVADWRWTPVASLQAEIDARPDAFTVWFRLLLDRALNAAARTAVA